MMRTATPHGAQSRRGSARTALSWAAVAVLSTSVVATAPRAFAGDDATDYAALLDAKAPTVVSVKFVLKMRMSHGGQSQDQEENSEVRGVLVDPSGLVMLGNDSLEGSAGMVRAMFRRRGGPGGMTPEISATPTDVKVLFGTDAKEYDAVVVARDSNLGLAYVQVLSLEGAAPVAVDLTKGGEVQVGQTLLGVNRKSRGFDCAPVLERLFVAGKVEKPRVMWAVLGAAGLGMPVYDAKARPVGVLVHQEGSSGVEEGGAGGLMAALGGGDASTFLLPLDAVTRSLEQVKKRVPDAVAKAAASKDAAKDDAPKAPAGMDEPAAPKAPEAPPAPDAPKPPEQPK